MINEVRQLRAMIDDLQARIAILEDDWETPSFFDNAEIPDFSGYVWVGRRRYGKHNLDPAKPFVRVQLGAVPQISEVDSMPEPEVEENCVYFIKAQTFGDARVDRLG